MPESKDDHTQSVASMIYSPTLGKGGIHPDVDKCPFRKLLFK